MSFALKCTKPIVMGILGGLVLFWMHSDWIILKVCPQRFYYICLCLDNNILMAGNTNVFHWKSTVQLNVTKAFVCF